jgi:hypothetical protein
MDCSNCKNRKGDTSVADKQGMTVLTSCQSLRPDPGGATDKHVSRLERQSAELHGADNKFHDFQNQLYDGSA